jgi:hypothetical protein
LVLRELEGLDYDEMSEVMESNRNAVGALLSRARLRFREELRMAQVTTDKAPEEECEKCIASLSPYIDGELSSEDVAEVESHLEQFTFCTAALEEMQEASRSFRMLIPVVPPADMAEAFTGRLQEAAQADAAASDAATRQEPVTAGGTRFASILGSRATWIVSALAVTLVLSVVLLADEIGDDGGPLSLFSDGDSEGTAEVVNFETMPSIRSAHTINIISGEEPAPTSETPDETQEPGQPQQPSRPETPEQPQTPQSNPPASIPWGGISYGSASPNPVYEYNPLSITVVVSGDAKSVSVDIGGAMTVPLSLVSEGGGQQTWSWSGSAPSWNNYAMTATASHARGSSSTGIGTLEVWYYLY